MVTAIEAVAAGVEVATTGNHQVGARARVACCQVRCTARQGAGPIRQFGSRRGFGRNVVRAEAESMEKRQRERARREKQQQKEQRRVERAAERQKRAREGGKDADL